MRRKTLFLGLAMLILISSGCADGEKPATDIGAGNVITIKQSTVGNFGDLRIGVGNIRESDYIDSGGVEQHGLTAGLSIYIGGESPREQDLNVYKGGRFEVDKYVLHVEGIKAGSSLPAPPGGSGGSISLRIEEKGQQ